jgi:hypothetical protein
MHDSLRIGFNFDRFQLGFGIIYAEEQTIMKDSNKNSTTGYDVSHAWVPVPLLSTGLDIPMGKYINTEIEIVGVPAPYLKSAVSFNF